MITRIDHVMICVPDLDQGMAQYRKLGFDMYPGGTHPGKGTHNAIAFMQEDYLELLAIRDPAEQRAWAAARAGGTQDLASFVAAGGGIRYIILQSDDLAKDVAGMRSRGVDVSDVADGSRRTPEGIELRWKFATLGPKNPLPIFFIEHLTPLDARRKQVPKAGDHPNGIYKIERAYIVTKDAAAEVEIYAKVLGMSVPKMEKGMVIMSNMFVFQLGPTGLGIVTPYGPGPGADALEHRGPGPFQVLYRTSSMGGAVRWMEANDMPPPARGVRNTGEQAMLVPPKDACGAYIGFVGME
jgi:catechol 2,3-dioxygenase-like lactoylglutathione lyase family enzyme